MYVIIDVTMMAVIVTDKSLTLVIVHISNTNI